ncbi:MAG: ABC transporter permease, partial [Vicinamibacterales bacterium]
VPAVQALGQCIFLPMLIIGGVAVQLVSLPPWAQHVSAFFPGRYAVEAMQASVTGDGVRVVGFSLLALFLIGAAACLAGVQMFRWDAHQRFATRGGKGWVAVALAAWAAVGVLAEARGRIGTSTIAMQSRTERALPPPSTSTTTTPPPPVSAPAPSPVPEPQPPSEPAPAPQPEGPEERTPESEPGIPSPKPRAPGPEAAPSEKPAEPSEKAAPPPGKPVAPPEKSVAPPEKPAEPPPPASEKTPSATAPPPEPRTWQAVTPAHIDQVMFERLPADAGVIAPIAPATEPLDPDLEAEIEEVRSRLVTWPPGRVTDPVQRVRNVLYVAAVPDVFQLPLERYLPHVVFERLREDVPEAELIKILFWVATHPSGGDDSAVDELRSAGLSVSGPSDIEQARERVMIYALKLLGRVTGKIPG